MIETDRFVQKLGLPGSMMSVRRFGIDDDFGLMRIRPQFWNFPEIDVAKAWTDSAFNPSKGFKIGMFLLITFVDYQSIQYL